MNTPTSELPKQPVKTGAASVDEMQALLKPSLDRIRVVLVNTQQPGNIGGAARAMKNMGLTDLVLVNPEIFPSDRAVWRSAGAFDLLETVQVVNSLEEAVSDRHLVIGTSARERRIPWPLVDPKTCCEKIRQESVSSKAALVFGREDSGLTNEELRQCHMHVHIPSNPYYSSLNLCAAVQTVAYEMRMQLLQSIGELPLQETWDEPFATNQAVEHLVNHFEQTLTDTGFLDPNNPRQTMTRIRRLFTRIRLDESEAQIMRGFLTSINRLKK